ncbi:MAG: DJ-1/PfpI family protein [Candidatus Tantalella remota]|nr:DJ-1/PfpI family protein [Candidatus Tantalella remota]
MSSEALMILAEGFEEVEAVTPLDVLRRAGVIVTVAGVGGKNIAGAHGISISADIVLEEYKGLPDAVILPGGLPGAENLAGSTKVKDILTRMNSEGRLIAAICASPALVLAPAGILDGKKAACYPGMEKTFSTGIHFVSEKVVQDGNIITSKGPATAFAFGVKIAENLVGKDKADMIAQQMLYEE